MKSPPSHPCSFCNRAASHLPIARTPGARPHTASARRPVGAAVRFTQHQRACHTGVGVGDNDRVAPQPHRFSPQPRPCIRLRLPAQQHPADQTLFAEHGTEKLAAAQQRPVAHDPDRLFLRRKARRASRQNTEGHKRREPQAVCHHLDAWTRDGAVSSPRQLAVKSSPSTCVTFSVW